MQDGTGTVGLYIKTKGDEYFNTTPFAIKITQEEPLGLTISKSAGLVDKDESIPILFTYDQHVY